MKLDETRSVLFSFFRVSSFLNWQKTAGKTQLVLFDQWNKCEVVDVKINGSLLDEKSFLKML